MGIIVPPSVVFQGNIFGPQKKLGMVTGECVYLTHPHPSGRHGGVGNKHAFCMSECGGRFILSKWDPFPKGRIPPAPVSYGGVFFAFDVDWKHSSYCRDLTIIVRRARPTLCDSRTGRYCIRPKGGGLRPPLPPALFLHFVCSIILDHRAFHSLLAVFRSAFRQVYDDFSARFKIVSSMVFRPSLLSVLFRVKLPDVLSGY